MGDDLIVINGYVPVWYQKHIQVKLKLQCAADTREPGGDNKAYAGHMPVDQFTWLVHVCIVKLCPWQFWYIITVLLAVCTVACISEKINI